jgi:hypothetical protein
MNLKASFETHYLIAFFAVENEYLIWKIDNYTCLLVASTWGELPHQIDVVLGVPVLRQFCTIFDVGNDQVGFAKKKNKEINI